MGEVTVSVQPLAPEPEDLGRVARGRIVDDRGEPVAGAIVSANSIHYDDGRGMYGSIDGLDPYAVSDSDGRFRICHAEAVDAIGVDIRAPGLAPQIATLRTGGEVGQVALDPGATVTGRLLRDGEGVAGAVVGLVQTNRSVDVFLGETTIATDEHGRFTFNNVATGHEYVVYGKMEAVAEGSATTPKRIVVEDASLKVGDLLATGGHTVAGRVVTTDGAALPPDLRVLVSAEVAWDSQLAVLDEAGRFELFGVPAGVYSVTVRVPGYRLTARNASLTPTWPTSLRGRIDGDLEELILEFEPGSPERPKSTRELWEREQELRGQPLRGAPRR